MKIVVSDNGFDWFKREMEVEAGDSIRFYVRYGGSSPFHEGFSLGMTADHPHEIGVQAKVNDVLFFIEKDDVWFFNAHDLHVLVDDNTDELVYEYKQSDNVE